MADTTTNAFCPECHCPGSFLHYPGCPRYLRDVASSSVVRLNDRDALLVQLADRDRRIEALTKALRAFVDADESNPDYHTRYHEECAAAKALLASAAGAEDTITPKGIQP